MGLQVVIIHKFSTEEEALKRANDTECARTKKKNIPLTVLTNFQTVYMLPSTPKTSTAQCASREAWSLARLQ